jgi:ferric-dicitrate binding protein FerR (iron transport regulator)
MELLDCVLDGSASDAERRRFARLVERRHDLTAEFVEQLRMHSLLQWKSDHLNLPAPQAVQRPRTRRVATDQRRTRLTGARHWAIAAVLLIATGVGSWLLLHGGRENREPIAEIIQNRETVWAEGSSALADAPRIFAGRLELVSGTTSLHFRSGAIVSLTGPTSMRIDTDMLVHLDSGQTTAEVPHSAKGFTVATAATDVVDRGTRFRVVAREDGGTDVLVYEGAVDLKPSSGTSTIQTCVRQQEAVRVDRKGSIVRLVQFQQEPLSEQWKDVRPLPAVTIQGAWDNLWSTKEDSHYLIGARGLADDSPAYVDHPHEWNGLTPEGLPKFLQNADYVRTFNDYRYLAELEISVDLARPAWLYVIYDDRSPVPDWLSQQFEETGIHIGLDEGPWENETPNRALGVGPGKSIDNIFSVWRRRCEKPGTVKLGAMNKGGEARAMYGIAAKPLD